ncbi:DUF2007 domain-containing protein [Muribaculaceae bacterium Isolate-104 (HZI)]|jgi:hypothetical protein|nr:DUF2007 domain-containing protein [Muribaculaceae bacterium Isolate-104 (HZI)]
MPADINPDCALVTLEVYDHDWQAHIAKGVLDEAGIPSIINNEIFGSVYPIGFNSIGGIALKVRGCDVAAAQKLLGHCSSGD